MAVARALAVLVVVAGAALAQPGPAPTPSQALRDGGAAAIAGDWPKVDALVVPLFGVQLSRADLAEAHRLAGLAADFLHRQDAEGHFVEYLKLDLDGRLDPSLYPPEVTQYFEEIRSHHDAELRALRPRARRYWLLNLIPPGGQIQNGDHVKAWVIGGMIGAFLVTNLTTYAFLAHWCSHASGPGGTSATCDSSSNHYRAASILRPLNIASGVGLILSYAYGVYDGVQGYRRHSEATVHPFVAPTTNGSVIGVVGSF